MTDQLAHETSEAISPRVVIVTGLSGSGKSTAIHAFEDLGWFCIDNLPVPLLPKVLELSQHRDIRNPQNLAFVVDTRDRLFIDQAAEVVEQMREEGVPVKILFLDTEDEVLLRRYSETRRPHPMSQGGTVREGIDRERERLEGLQSLADLLIDTSKHNVHTLKAAIREHFGGEEDARRLQINILSFGFKHGLPSECDTVFDVRFLQNPYFVEGLREQTGLDEAVNDYVIGQDESGAFLRLVRQWAELLLPLYEREGKAYLTIGIGCTGGHHRSVAISEAVAQRLRGKGWPVQVRHRDIGK